MLEASSAAEQAARGYNVTNPPVSLLANRADHATERDKRRPGVGQGLASVGSGMSPMLSRVARSSTARTTGQSTHFRNRPGKSQGCAGTDSTISGDGSTTAAPTQSPKNSVAAPRPSSSAQTLQASPQIPDSDPLLFRGEPCDTSSQLPLNCRKNRRLQRSPAEPVSVSSGHFATEHSRCVVARTFFTSALCWSFCIGPRSFHIGYSTVWNADGRGRRRVDSQKKRLTYPFDHVGISALFGFEM